MRRDEFERLALAELDAVYRFARFLTRNAEDAEELVQDVFARAFRPDSIKGFTSRRGGMRGWLMTIARTSFYGRLEHEQAGRRAMDRFAQILADQQGSLEAPDPSRVARIDWTQAAPGLSAGLDSLSAELREVLWLWAVEGMKYREIAAAMSIPIGTVMSRLHRARSQVAAFVIGGAPPVADRTNAPPVEPVTTAAGPRGRQQT